MPVGLRQSVFDESGERKNEKEENRADGGHGNSERKHIVMKHRRNIRIYFQLVFEAGRFDG